MEREEKEKKLELEKKIKRTKGYVSGTKKLINLSDHHGKTALHYAVMKSNFFIVKQLLKNKAYTLIRDYK
jgi:hypothetical protein